MAEIWDLVDECGNKVGRTWLRSDHDNIPAGLYHPCVEVWVRIGEELLITRRHPDKSEGLMYDCPGGAVQSGESFIKGALRELREEVGICVREEDLVYLGALTGRTAYAVSYVAFCDHTPEIILQPSEVVGYKIVGRAEFEAMLDQLTHGTRARYGIYKDSIFN